jgi:sugar/nucleoside kinase (ribokinase family)
MNHRSHQFDLIGVGAPIMDIVAAVPDSFLAHTRGEKGGMVMVEADEMAALVAKLPAPPALTPGGSAANTIFNATRLGLRTAFVGKLGGDELARLYRARFDSAGVHTARFKQSDLPNARCLILTTPDAQRTMRTCLGAVMTLSPDEIRPEDFAGARHAHIEGYVVFNRALAESVLRAARAAGCTISLDLASFEVVRSARDWLLQELKTGLHVVFANEDEIRALFPDAPNADYAALARRLASYGCTAAVKLGKDGAWIAHGNELHLSPPHKISDAIDSNGAGDAWAAGFLAAYLRDHPLPTCGSVASLLGAETVRHMGPIIPDAHWPAIATRASATLGSPSATLHRAAKL